MIFRSVPCCQSPVCGHFLGTRAGLSYLFLFATVSATNSCDQCVAQFLFTLLVETDPRSDDVIQKQTVTAGVRAQERPQPQPLPRPPVGGGGGKGVKHGKGRRALGMRDLAGRGVGRARACGVCGGSSSPEMRLCGCGVGVAGTAKEGSDQRPVLWTADVGIRINRVSTGGERKDVEFLTRFAL